MFDPHTSFLTIKEKEKFDQAMHNEFVEPSKTNADMILSGESDFSDACLDIERRLHSYLKRSS